MHDALYVFHAYTSCQLAYVVAQELSDAGAELDRAIWEGKQVADQVMASSVPLSLGAPPGYVHWPDWLCFAQWFAAQPDAGRMAIIEGGLQRPAWAQLMLGSQQLGCDRSKLDERYLPEPPCIPRQAPKVALAAVGAGLLAFAVGKAIGAVRR
jgi:hypothetical protein